MKVLITGGCGFIGSNLVRLLEKESHEVSILDNMTKGSISNLPSNFSGEIIEADIRDLTAVQMASSNKDAIVHLAAFGSVVESVNEPSENFSVNASGTFTLLEGARVSGIKKVIFASTGGALIGNANPPVDESSLPRPISPYGASKLAGEGYCCAFASAYDMNITALRFANVLGPISLHKKGAVTSFFKAIHNESDIQIYGDGMATRDFLYVDDLCKGIYKGLISELDGFNVFHLASGREVTITELAKLAIETTNTEEVRIVYKPKRAGEVERNFAGYKLAKKKLDWEPTTSLEEALHKTWKWFEKEWS